MHWVLESCGAGTARAIGSNARRERKRGFMMIVNLMISDTQFAGGALTPF